MMACVLRLLSHPVIGGSWEGFCLETPIATAPAGTKPYFYRASTGQELDLVLRLRGGAVWTIEIKSTTTPKVSRAFHLAANDIGADRRPPVCAGERDVPIGYAIRAMPPMAAMAALHSLRWQDSSPPGRLPRPLPYPSSWSSISRTACSSRRRSIVVKSRSSWISSLPTAATHLPRPSRRSN